jgi:glycosyltransferase involved in cell wall biosynthesis
MILTIITINYNNASGLQKTMESVLNQTSKEFEYIIVDGSAPHPPKGGVSDRAVIESFVKNVEGQEIGFTHCTWLSPEGGVGGGFYSEPDSGIYNAMNKGIRMAKGDYIHFLNSGDWLVDEFVVEKMLKELRSFELGVLSKELELNSSELGVNSSEFGVRGSNLGFETTPIDIFVGNKIMVRPDGKVRYGHNDKRPVTALTFYRGTIEHTSAYIRRAMFDVVGMYDESLRIVSDWKWYFDAVLNHNARVAFTDIFVSYFDNAGISSTNLTLDKAERRQVLEQMLPPAVLADYDRYHFTIDQHERLHRYPLLNKLVYLTERILFKFDKWNAKYWSWKKK